MQAQDDLPKRGRPQTLDRGAVLNIAMMRYWADGPTRVAIGQICMDAHVSKPSLYREFGNDDGLKDAVLSLYRDMVLVPFFDILNSDARFADQIAALIAFTVQDRDKLGIPRGCLQVAMRAHRDDLGAATRARVDEIRGETLAQYTTWVARARSRGELGSDISPQTAAHFCDAQNGAAMRMQREGMPNNIIAQMLQLGFSSLV